MYVTKTYTIVSMTTLFEFAHVNKCQSIFQQAIEKSIQTTNLKNRQKNHTHNFCTFIFSEKKIPDNMESGDEFELSDYSETNEEGILMEFRTIDYLYLKFTFGLKCLKSRL